MNESCQLIMCNQNLILIEKIQYIYISPPLIMSLPLKTTPLIKTHFRCRSGGLVREGLLYTFFNKFILEKLKNLHPSK